MTEPRKERRYDLDPTLSNRTKNCGLCVNKGVRIHVRVGTPEDPDYVVAVCPKCDMTKGKHNDSKNDL